MPACSPPATPCPLAVSPSEARLHPPDSMLSCHSVAACLPASARPGSCCHCVTLFALRARSGRSGCASSAALRPAFACDRAGTARRAEPRCSPPSHETLGRGQRFHPPVWPLGARTLRRNGSYRPRGGFHLHPPGSLCTCTHLMLLPGLSPHWHSHRVTGGGLSIRRCRGWPISPEPAVRGRGRRSVRPQAAGAAKAAPSHPRDRHKKLSRSERKSPAADPQGNTGGVTT
jgi:hypothetical protein